MVLFLIAQSMEIHPFLVFGSLPVMRPKGEVVNYIPAQSKLHRWEYMWEKNVNLRSTITYVVNWVRLIHSKAPNQRYTQHEEVGSIAKYASLRLFFPLKFKVWLSRNPLHREYSHLSPATKPRVEIEVALNHDEKSSSTLISMKGRWAMLDRYQLLLQLELSSQRITKQQSYGSAYTMPVFIFNVFFFSLDKEFDIFLLTVRVSIK